MGTRFDDKISGNGVSNVINGHDGNDTIQGGAGADFLDGGLNFGRTDTDTVTYSDSSAGVIVNLQTRVGSGGTAEGDELIDFERLIGSKYDDRLIASTLGDEIRGGDGKDTLVGDIGNDRLYGDAGNDRLLGGGGADVQYGGTGADTFIFRSVSDSTVAASGRDTISGFSSSERDIIDMSGVDANTAASGNQAFVFIGSQAFHGVNGELRFQTTSESTVVSGDVNGDKLADFSIKLVSSSDLHTSDFIL